MFVSDKRSFCFDEINNFNLYCLIIFFLLFSTKYFKIINVSNIN